MAVEIMIGPRWSREDRRRISVRLCALETSRGSPCHARERGQARLLFLPPSDLNPIEMAFAKLKAHLRAVAMRTIDELWKAIGHICDLFIQRNAQATSQPSSMDSMSVRCSSELPSWRPSQSPEPTSGVYQRSRRTWSAGLSSRSPT